MKETRDVDTAGSFGQMSFCQVDIDSGHGKQAGNDLHTCTLYICGSWAPKKSKNGDTNALIFEKKQLRPSPKEPSEQSDTEIVESSPEPAQDEDQDDLAGLDWKTLTDRHYQACAEVHKKTKELCRAQNKAMRLAKRMKIMQDAQDNAPAQVDTPSDDHMGTLD